MGNHSFILRCTAGDGFKNEANGHPAIVFYCDDKCLMSKFFRVCKTFEVPDPGQTPVDVDQHPIVLVHLDGTFYALDDACSRHNGMLGKGLLEGHQIICPCHGAHFDVRTGQVLDMPDIPGTLVHEVEVEGTDVFVKV
jgi:3-phenylpropionate/trans-cinnamate dioxygenase ferredoxin component